MSSPEFAYNKKSFSKQTQQPLIIKASLKKKEAKRKSAYFGPFSSSIAKLVKVVFLSPQSAHKRTDTSSANHVNRYVCFNHRLDHANMRRTPFMFDTSLTKWFIILMVRRKKDVKIPSASSSQHHANRSARKETRQSREICHFVHFVSVKLFLHAFQLKFD